MPTRITDAPTLLATPAELRRWSLRCHTAGQSVGMVPTMGALHAGHLSLIEHAVAECDRVVVSIFVNPTQFGPSEDYERYPRSRDADLAMLSAAGAHAAFVPSLEAMLPDGMATSVRVVGGPGEGFEASRRPGHLDGVALVVTKLLSAGRPDRAYFGQKDAQQCAVVRRLARDLDTGVDVVICPTIRDADGLALSSRNAYLSPDERQRALAIPAGLAAAMARHAAGERDAAALRAVVLASLEASGLAVDYVAVVDAESFIEVETASPTCQILVAATIGTTRLIDVVRLGFDAAPVVVGASGRACNGL